MNTLTTITKLTHAEFNLGVAKIAELAGMSQHMQDKAKDLGFFLQKKSERKKSSEYS